jgi:hypothetical protein
MAAMRDGPVRRFRDERVDRVCSGKTADPLSESRP